MTTRQLRASGIDDAQIHRWSRQGRLERVAPQVYRLPGAPETWEQRALAAVLASPPGAALSHRAAAALHGFRGFPRGRVEVTAPRWRRLALPGVHLHESLALFADDRTVLDAIPVTTPIRTLVDLGAVAHPRKVGVALDECRRQGVVDLGDMAVKVQDLAVQGRNGIGVARALLEERMGKRLASTGFEQLFLDIVVTAGLPEPVRQHRVQHGEFVAYLDFAYPQRLVGIEADSAQYHLDLEQFHYDRERQNRLVALGWTILRYTERHLTKGPQEVIGTLRGVLGPDFCPR